MATAMASRRSASCCIDIRPQLITRRATSTTSHHHLSQQPMRHRSATTKRPHKHAVIPPPTVNTAAPTHPYLPDITSNTNTNITLMAEPIGIREYLLYVTVALGSMFTGAQLVHWYFKPDLHIPTEQELKERERKAELHKQQKQQAATTATPAAAIQPTVATAAPPQQASSNQ